MCEAQKQALPNKVNKSLLLAFDFDHSLIDVNSDNYVTKLVPPIPVEIKKRYSSQCWVYYMGAIFEHMHQQDITPTQILNCMNEIPFVNGAKELVNFLDRDDAEMIIISDANSVFIKQVLENAKIAHLFAETFTNPAHFDETGCLRVQCYHNQDWCQLSTTNLCKGRILEDYLKKRCNEGVTFSHVGFVGDGIHDYCPCLTLREKDFTFPRINYNLWKKINKMPKDDELSLKSQIVPWTDAFEILETVKTVL
ncbi:pyridoxal phosphate phosphatase PHOSPHO2 [Octopus bimaculoides]|uniref:Pyridoxal phosphate phosphatase PHOSPHO2 n=1 Tax=Octopus bimaculoides TaxID=37653 RepID=A0A0L8I5Z0_OCTBM|nr:pyridoxal phosphate phosphatase PHOSPHO2 [Octopus bimaculoides]|eukprot:XP_014790638.1 PREDICTED: pyridoxal phosphate phosphatase PHOSPHO2-like [Octopus bimaculoides]